MGARAVFLMCQLFAHACWCIPQSSQAQWTNGGEKVIASGRRPFFYVYDAHSGTATKVRF